MTDNGPVSGSQRDDAVLPEVVDAMLPYLRNTSATPQVGMCIGCAPGPPLRARASR